MSETENIQDELKKLRERLDDLEKCSNAACTGGMLSSTTFRDLVIHRGRSDLKHNYDDYVGFFHKRDWGKIGGRFIIQPYDELNLTPFSYDLSVGREVVSARAAERMSSPLPYKLEPGETAIVLTREYIALPQEFSATVWPRFRLVREGIFQSMVKIDPTWYGHLAVAISNFSPRTQVLEEGMAFGTLILYGLTAKTDLDLAHPEKLDPVSVNVSHVAGYERIAAKLDHLSNLEGVAWIEKGCLKVRAIKQSEYVDLRSLDPSSAWKRAVDDARQLWTAEPEEGERRHGIGMKGLGMENLLAITTGDPKGETADPQALSIEQETSDGSLMKMATTHGKPFDTVALLPEALMRRIDQQVAPRIQAEVENSIFPRIIMLTFTVLGFLALIVGVLSLMLGSKPDVSHVDETLLQSIILVVAAVVVIGLFFMSRRTRNAHTVSDYYRRLDRIDQRTKDQQKDLRKEVEGLKQVSDHALEDLQQRHHYRVLRRRLRKLRLAVRKK